MNKLGVAEIGLAIGSLVLVSLHFDLTFFWIGRNSASLRAGLPSASSLVILTMLGSVHPEVSSRPPPAFAAAFGQFSVWGWDKLLLLSALQVIGYFSTMGGTNIWALFIHELSAHQPHDPQGALVSSPSVDSQVCVVENTCGWFAHSTTQREKRNAGSTFQVVLFETSWIGGKNNHSTCRQERQQMRQRHVGDDKRRKERQLQVESNELHDRLPKRRVGTPVFLDPQNKNISDGLRKRPPVYLALLCDPTRTKHLCCSFFFAGMVSVACNWTRVGEQTDGDQLSMSASLHSPPVFLNLESSET